MKRTSASPFGPFRDKSRAAPCRAIIAIATCPNAACQRSGEHHPHVAIPLSRTSPKRSYHSPDASPKTRKTGLALLALLLGGYHTWAFALCLAHFGLFISPMAIWAQTLRMRLIPEALRGRTFALLRMLMQSGDPLGGASAVIRLPLVGLTATIGRSTALVGYTVRTVREARSPPPRQKVATTPPTAPIEEETTG